jgi:glycine betaine/proline transport system substrate-binding protein
VSLRRPSEFLDQAKKNLQFCLKIYIDVCDRPSSRSAEEAKYIYDEGTILSAGPLGMVGQVGWYVPRYVLDEVPDALFGDFADPTVAGYFNNTLIVGDPNWMVVEEQIIKDQNYSLNVEFLSGEIEMTEMLFERYANKEQMLFYFWKPHTLDSIFSLMRVQLPNDSVYYPPEILSKIMWAGLPEYSPETAFFVQSFALNGNQMTQLLANLYEKRSLFDVACDWVKNNEQIWENWIRPCKLQHYVSWSRIDISLQ